MGHLCRVAISVLAVMVLFPHWAASEENDALQALERVRVGLVEGISYRELGGLLDEAQVQINTLRKDEGSDCFRAAANQSYYWYDLGRKTWETMTENTEQRDKYFRQAEYGEHRMKTINMTMAENYDKLVKHTQDALPTKWEYGNAALESARSCLGQ
ncbi:MAG: hypothetical protein JRI70_04050 [Deltaproteobacteria bacterium]|nr:hypothetical protein [Deltaproteobacteria bacterium]MBW2171458.1 hypothetical protein [Deltaproteobacteria bacterium]